MAGTLGDLIVTVGAKIDGFVDAMKEIKDHLDDLGHESEEASEHVEGGFAGMINGIKEHAGEFKEHMESMGEAAIGLQMVGRELTEALTERIKEIGEEALHAAANTEELGIVFRTLTGSTEGATETIEALHKTADNSVLGLSTLEKGQQRLMAFGFAGKDAIDIMTTLGNVSHAFGRGDEGIDTLIGVLGKIRAQGSISKKNLTGLNKFGGTSAIAEGMGITETEVTQRAAKPGIQGTEGMDALLTGWQTKFGGVMSQEMGGFNGIMANLKNKIELTMDEIGQILLPVAKNIATVLGSIMDHLKQLAEWFRTLPEPVQNFATAMIGLAAGIGPLLVLIGGLILAFTSIIGSIGTVTLAVIQVAEALGTTAAAVLGTVATFSGWAFLIVTAVAIVLAALAAFGVWVYQHWDGVKAATAQIWDGLKEIWNATLGVALNWVIEQIEGVVRAAAPAWEAFKNGIVDVWHVITNVIGESWNWLKDHVITPMMDWLKSLPGVTEGLEKLKGAGAAFEKADAESKASSQRTKDLQLMAPEGQHQGRFHILSDKERFEETHAAAIKEQAEALERLKQDYYEGKITLEQLHRAQANYNALLREKGPASDAANAAKGKEKIDHNALDAITAAHAHQEAILAMQKAAVNHDYQMSQLGSADKVGMDESDVAGHEITAAETRKKALDAIALQERDATLKEIDAKLALYKDDADNHQKLLGDKAAAEVKYQAELQRNRQQEESIVKNANDKIKQDDLKSIEEDMKAENQHQHALLQMQDQLRQAKMKAAEDNRVLQDEYAQILLEKAQITQKQYLQLQQKFLDDAYKQEMDAIAKERADLDKEYGLGDMSEDTYKQKSGALDAKADQTTAKHQLDTVKNSAQLDKDQYAQWFKPMESSFTSGITAMIEGTKTFKQAFSEMARSILAQWLQTLIQQKVAFFMHKLQEVIFHKATNEIKVADDASAAAQSKSITLAQHFHEVMLAAKSAAAWAAKAVAGIPVVGPILAPIAAAATYVAVMALSAEHGAVLPNENTIGFLHPKEMVLPRHLSEGIQNMIASGGASKNVSPNSYTHVPSGPMSSDIVQAIHGGAAAAQTHNWGGVQLTVHNNASDPINGSKLFDSFMGEVRRRNLKMA